MKFRDRVEEFLEEFDCKDYLFKIWDEKPYYSSYECVPKLSHTKDFRRYYNIKTIRPIIFLEEDLGYVPKILIMLEVKLDMNTVSKNSPF